MILEFDPAGMLREPLSNLNPGETCIMRHPNEKWMGPYEVVKHGAAIKPGLSAAMMNGDPYAAFTPMAGATVIAVVLKEDAKGGKVMRTLQYIGVPSTVEVVKIWR